MSVFATPRSDTFATRCLVRSGREVVMNDVLTVKKLDTLIGVHENWQFKMTLKLFFLIFLNQAS